MIFWTQFKRHWGEPSEPPVSYWRPWLGGMCGVRPSDIGGLTPYQLDACRKWAESQGVTFG